MNDKTHQHTAAPAVILTVAVASFVLAALCATLWAVAAVIFGIREAAPPMLLLVFAMSATVAAAIGVVTKARHESTAPFGMHAILAAGVAAITIAYGALLGVVGAYGLWAAAGIPVTALLAMYLISRLSKGVYLYSGQQVSSIILCFAHMMGVFLFAIAASLPFYFMIVASVRPRALLLQNPTNLTIPVKEGFANLFNGYVEVITRFKFARYILNSTVVSLLTVVITLIPAILGAYAVTRLRFRGRKFLSNAILLIYMFPAIVLAIPLYSIFTQIGVRNSLFGLLIVYPAMTIPVALYMLRSYFQTLPRDIEEAGLIDGCTRGGVILRITLPLSMPALASVALYVFMIAWNEFLFAFMFLDNPEIFTLSRGVVSLNTQEVPRQFLMAGSVIITVPIIVLFFYFEKFLVGGLASGGVKG